MDLTLLLLLLLFQMTFQQICKDVHTVKTNGQQVFIESRNRLPLKKQTNAGKKKGQLPAVVYIFMTMNSEPPS